MNERSQTEIIKPRTLAGFRDILPDKALVKEEMIANMKAVFRGFGYAPIETPHLEYTEVLIGQSGGEIGKQLYRFNDNGNRDVTLRFDLTVPLARFAVQHANELGRPFKRYAVGNVFRGESPQAGRYREFTQCDFDCIGGLSASADAEIILIIHDALIAIGLDKFKVSINTRKLLEGIVLSSGGAGSVAEVLRTIDKLHKIGRRKVTEELSQIATLGAEGAERILSCLLDTAESGDFWEGIENLSSLHPMAKEGVEELKKLELHLVAAGMPSERRSYDLSIARGLGYYTGVIFETTLDDVSGIGSICSGGRYDNLTSSFSKQGMPGVGASFGIDRLMAALEDIGGTAKASPSDILVAVLEEGAAHGAQGLASRLRKGGLAVELYPESAKLAKQFAYAERKGIRFLVAYGSNELDTENYILADLSNGEKLNANGEKGILELIAERQS